MMYFYNSRMLLEPLHTTKKIQFMKNQIDSFQLEAILFSTRYDWSPTWSCCARPPADWSGWAPGESVSSGQEDHPVWSGPLGDRHCSVPDQIRLVQYVFLTVQNCFAATQSKFFTFIYLIRILEIFSGIWYLLLAVSKKMEFSFIQLWKYWYVQITKIL